ncbi:MAG: hypothetical protein V1834_00905 [Candidatus Micrarchaeota archaeon]
MAKFMPAARTRELREQGIEKLPELRQAQFHASTVLHAEKALAKLEKVPRHERSSEHDGKVALVQTELKKSHDALFDLLRSSHTTPVTKKQIINYNAALLDARGDAFHAKTTQLGGEVQDTWSQHPLEVRKYALRQLAGIKPKSESEAAGRAGGLENAFFDTYQANQGRKEYNAEEKEIRTLAVGHLLKGLEGPGGSYYAGQLIDRIMESHSQGVREGAKPVAAEVREDVTKQVTDYLAEKASPEATQAILHAIHERGQSMMIPQHNSYRPPENKQIIPFVKALAAASKRGQEQSGHDLGYTLTEQFKKDVHEHVFGRGVLGQLEGMSTNNVYNMPETGKGTNKAEERDKLWKLFMPKPKRNELEF